MKMKIVKRKIEAQIGKFTIIRIRIRIKTKTKKQQ